MTVIDLPRNMLINFPHLLADVNVVRAGHRDDAGVGTRRDPHPLLAQDQRPACACRWSWPTRSSRAARDQQGGLRSLDRAQDQLPIPFDQRSAASTPPSSARRFADANCSTKAAAVMRDIAKAVIGAGGEDARRPPVGRRQVAARQVRPQVAACPKKGKQAPRSSDLREPQPVAHDPAAGSPPHDDV